jgi:hypothetical protein
MLVFNADQLLGAAKVFEVVSTCTENHGTPTIEKVQCSARC